MNWNILQMLQMNFYRVNFITSSILYNYKNKNGTISFNGAIGNNIEGKWIDGLIERLDDDILNDNTDFNNKSYYDESPTLSINDIKID